LTVTCVAFAAVTVKVEELPAVIEAGLALMLTVGAGDALTARNELHPSNTKRRTREATLAGSKV